MEIETPEELEALPNGAVILDNGLHAKKTNGAWRYEAGFFEPEHFPVKYLYTLRGES